MTTKIKKLIQKGKLLVLSAILFSFAFLPMVPQKALAANSNDVIYGGVSSLQDLANKINSGSDGIHGDIGTIFRTLGIYPEEFLTNGNIDGANRQTVDGWVYKDGRVVLANGTVVASGNVISAGRSNLPGSTPDVFGLPIYWRHPSVSFIPDRLSAYVHLVNGQFSWAVLTSCGNPIKNYGNPSATIHKEIRNVTKNSNWSTGTISGERGDVIEYRISYQVGSESLNNVWVYDTLKGRTSDGQTSNREYLNDPANLSPSWFQWYPNGIDIAGYKDSRMLAWYAPGRAPQAAGVAYFRSTVKTNTPDNTLICNDAAFYADRLGAILSNKVCLKIEVPQPTPTPTPTPTSTPPPSPTLTPTSTPTPTGSVLAAYTEKTLPSIPVTGAASVITLGALSTVLGYGRVLKRKLGDKFVGSSLEKAIRIARKKKGL